MKGIGFNKCFGDLLDFLITDLPISLRQVLLPWASFCGFSLDETFL